MELNGQSAISELMPSWDMNYRSGRLISTDADTYTDTRIALRQINAEQDARVQECLRELGMGYGDDEKIVDLSELKSDYVAQDGDVLTGELKTSNTIYIADGATVTLSNCTILSENRPARHEPAITCKGSANIISTGNNSLSGAYGGNPAIYVPQGSTLTISGYGTLDAKSTDMGAGIGSGNAKDYKDCGNIIIKSGIVNAHGDYASAGIGSTQTGSCGDITIKGGEAFTITPLANAQ